MATAIYVKTESSDSYLYCVDGKLSSKEVKEYLKEQLGDEYEYICEKMVVHSNKQK